MAKTAFLLGAAAGYVLGTRAGRERYEQIRTTAQQFWQNPKVQQRVTEVEERAAATASDLSSTAKEKAGDLAGQAKEKVAAVKEQRASGSDDPGDSSGTEPYPPVVEVPESGTRTSTGRLT